MCLERSDGFAIGGRGVEAGWLGCWGDRAGVRDLDGFLRSDARPAEGIGRASRSRVSSRIWRL